jgi:glutamate dehydrogenase
MTIAEERLQDRVTALIAAQEPDGRAALLRAFTEAYLRRHSRADADPQAILNEIRGAFDLVASRGRRPAVVRAFTPEDYDCTGSVVEANTDDLPYLVDSLQAALQSGDHGVRRVVHPIIGTERGHEGELLAVSLPRDSARRESFMHFELDHRLEPDELHALEERLLSVLGDVRRVVADYPAMSQVVGTMVERARQGAGVYPFDDVNEAIAFLRWLLEGNFTFLGYREYEAEEGVLRVKPGSGLGLLADERSSHLASGREIRTLRPSVQARIDHGDLLVVTKTNAFSPVRRRTRMDYVGVRFEAGPPGDGEPFEGERRIGECRLIGLFTTKAYSAPAAETPLLHHKLRRILEAEDLIDGSHDHRNAVAIFGSFPKDELFAAGWQDLRAMVVDLLGMQADEVRVLGRRSHDDRTAAVVVAIPRGRFSAPLVERIEQALRKRYEDATLESHVVVDDQFTHARVHYTVHSPSGELPAPDLERLETDVARLTRPWDQAVEAVLRRTCGRVRAAELAGRWCPRFPDFYKAATEPDLAAADVERLQELDDSDDELVVGLQHAEGRSGPRTRLTLYKEGGKVALSEILPTLEMLGLRVYDERPTRLHGGDEQTFVQNFGVLGPDGAPLDLELLGRRLPETILAVRRGDTDSDWLSKLVIVAGLTWQQVGMLRAYRVYRQRAGARFGLKYDGEAFASQPHLAVKLVRYFELRHGAGGVEADDHAADDLRRQILEDLDAVQSLDQDRILRDQLTLIDATLRTNAFRPGRDAMAIKLRSADVPGLPAPKPFVEVFVHSVAMEGIHLRGGAIARGGLRWSDRLDFRTEVYGLMRAQMTKNAVIVPTGAKGGFYLRRRPEDPAALREEVARQYDRYIRALLDITDNLAGGEVVHPEGVRVLDGDDPYLVVAADKGTATFSDRANAIAAEYGFWLGDAFASGGSEGYDHKKLGITARGAWESVKRHFRELGVDPERDEISAVGIGDMSGDVFGNGMLLSRTIRLLAAYDHRHVFLDPDPEPEAAWQERKRLFDAPSSSWADYDPAVLSEGGGVYPRTAKSVPLSEPVRAALGVEADHLTPDELIRAILRAPVDLLFNGGIGTVVKASAESDGDAHDRASDAIRVDASELRCRVVGEGGNLGFTQHARIEFSSLGGNVNADFIDNSAGVDCSDHEVNVKILLDHAELDAAGRHDLLVEMTDDVVAHVLQDSYRQARILSREVTISGQRLYAYEDLMTALEEEGILDRTADALPSATQLGQRRRSGAGLHRPELAVLVAHAKRSLTDALLPTPLLDDPWLARDLRGYFPRAAVERLGDQLVEHRLHRELIATLVANEVVDAFGPSFVSRLATELGVPAATVVRAYRIARDVTGATGRLAAIDALDTGLGRDVEVELVEGVDRLVEDVTRWYIHHAPSGGLGEVVEAGHEGFDALEDALEANAGERMAGTVERLGALGVPQTLALAHALTGDLVLAPDVLLVAGQSDRGLEEVGEAFALAGERLRFGWLEAELQELPAAQRVQRWAVQALRDDARRARREVVAQALAEHPDLPAAEALDRSIEARERRTDHLVSVMRSLSVDGADLAGLMVVVRELRALID